MKPIAFIDTEVEVKSEKIRDIGGIKGDGGSFHSGSIRDFIGFLHGTDYLCGHNILQHDLKYLQTSIHSFGIYHLKYIDTLCLSPLMFPAKPYHALLKDDKLQTDELNNPLNDAIKAKDLFFDEVAAFQRLDEKLKQIYYCLLKDQKEFSSFFAFLGYTADTRNIEDTIREKFYTRICVRASLTSLTAEYPIELAYCLALINTDSRFSITPPWVLKNYPNVERIMYLLRHNPCIEGCAYCNEALDIYKGLKRLFTYDSYRTFGGEPLQEKAVQAAVANKSLLAIFPTGGGKSITFQVPALMSGVNTKGLTVVISPLQSLMKDQVDNLEKAGITEAVTINGLLDPIERAMSIERVADGSASILYIAPESLRSRSIERLLLGRNIARFVIDEAHCFSSWGQDFRVDYLYIGDFIKSLQEKKNLTEGIPVSCLTATAKPMVIEDIRKYFREKLSLELELYTTGAARSNLQYKVLPKKTEEEKYNTVRDLLGEKNCPTIIYMSRTRSAYELAERLFQDGYRAKPYHGQMDKTEKSENQDAFMRGDVQIIVATSAFGMGVDKKDVGMVIHYEISDSLENYIQEAGRAGRDEKITADCFVLFNDEDLNKHFILLNQTKLGIKEIQQIWQAIKKITEYRLKASQSALEIARKAGWDESISNLETKVKTAINALEEAGYLKRGYNMPRVFADSILVKNAEEAINRINASHRFDEKQKVAAIRVIRRLISEKSSQWANGDDAVAQIDYISEHLGLVREEVIEIITLLREEKILGDMKDLHAFIKKREQKNRSLNILKAFIQIEKHLFEVLENEEKVLNLKEINEQAEANDCEGVTVNKIKTILNFWSIKKWIQKKNLEQSHVAVICMEKKEVLEQKIAKRFDVAQFILEYLNERTNKPTPSEKEEVLVEFSVLELKQAFEYRMTFANTKVSTKEIEEALFYLSRIEALTIEGGFLIVYNSLMIERLELDNRRKYRNDDYQKLEQFYNNKMQQIHIVGEYAKKMLDDYNAALRFVDDYFSLNYSSFLNRYFPGSRQNEIKRNITPAKFKQLFGELSPTQLKIINDKESKYIVVAAGPGSGKTRILVHKLASLLMMEDVKHEQLLMLTFSRAAATDFKKKLLKLYGNAANFIEIKTFHSYCFDLLGRVGTLEKSDEIIKETIKRIQNKEVEESKITKTVLVIDEAQDMNAEEFALVKALMEQNEEMRVIAVGDDDQNIYEFRGADAKHLEALITEYKAIRYELVENYRSKSNLVEFTNQFVKGISRRLKSTPIVAHQRDNGKIKLVRHKGASLITPLVADILSEGLGGSVCILTRTNEEALQITGLLVQSGMPAKLIQSNDGFSLYNLLEVRYFIEQLNLTKDVHIIANEDWENATKSLHKRFRSSLNLEICLNMIRDFSATNPKYKYKSDLEVYIRESKMEDFMGINGETIFVSTIHKAKGREFDNVYLLLNGFKFGTDEVKRQLYVAMTRAKRNLTIHYNGSYLDDLKATDLNIVHDSKEYSPLNQIVMQLTHKDVVLDYFISRQQLIAELNSEDTLLVDEGYCCNRKGDRILKFSQKFREEIKQKNYQHQSAKIRFIVYWQKEDAEQEIRIVLPEVCFTK